MEILNTNHATILGRQKNIRKLLETKVRQHGDKPFIIFIDKDDQEEVLTYRQFDEKVNRLANWLKSRGVSKGDFVLTHLPNSSGFAIASHAVTKLGAIFIPSITLSIFGFRAIRNERFRIAEQTENDHRRTADLLKSRISLKSDKRAHF